MKKKKAIQGVSGKREDNPTVRKYTRGTHPNSLANLKDPFEKGNTKSIKHGMYAKQLSPYAKEIYDTLEDMDELDMLHEVIMIQFSNFISSQKDLDLSEKDLAISGKAGETLAKLVKDYKLLTTKLGNTENDDGFITALMKSAELLWDDDQ